MGGGYLSGRCALGVDVESGLEATAASGAFGWRGAAAWRVTAFRDDALDKGAGMDGHEYDHEQGNERAGCGAHGCADAAVGGKPDQNDDDGEHQRICQKEDAVRVATHGKEIGHASDHRRPNALRIVHAALAVTRSTHAAAHREVHTHSTAAAHRER